jgi:hypothetical protein
MVDVTLVPLVPVCKQDPGLGDPVIGGRLFLKKGRSDPVGEFVK